MAVTLPHRPHLERFRRDARRLQRAVRDGDAEARAQVERVVDRPVDATELPLAVAQLAVARRHGFSSWPRLREYLRTAERLGRDTSSDPGEDPTARLLAHACLVYDESDGPDRWSVARELLTADPAAPQRDPYVAATVADPDAVAAHLARDPGLARTEGGPFGWTMLFHLAYSRVPQRDPLGTARLLLDAGADPEAGYLWQGAPTPFTVLTGCFGGGEQGPGRQPAHPQGSALARSLVARGADPNDAQTLYDRMFARDDEHLRVLLPLGLGHGSGGAWHRRLGEALETPDEMVRRQVDWARDHGFEQRLALLAEHGFTEGTTPDAPTPWPARRGLPPVARAGTPQAVRSLAAAGGDLDAPYDGRTALHFAAWVGDVELVKALLESGADPTARDATYGTTPLAWAEHAHADATATLLRPVTPPD